MGISTTTVEEYNELIEKNLSVSKEGVLLRGMSNALFQLFKYEKVSYFENDGNYLVFIKDNEIPSFKYAFVSMPIKSTKIEDFILLSR